MICIWNYAHPLLGRGQAVEELLLRFQTHDPILVCTDHQSRRLNCTGVGEQAFRGVVKIEKHVHRDLPKDERIGIVKSGLRFVVRQHS